jgi:exosortase
MFPLPDFFKRTVLAELLRVATIASTFVLQTLGVVTHREGNIIYVADQGLNVVEACAGLRMLTIFVAMSVAIILVVKRPWWDQLIILLSAVPIAIAANVIRITITGLLFLVAGDSDQLKTFFHDWSGLLVMMPVGMGILYLELFILEKLLIEERAPELVRGRIRKGGVPVIGR